MKALSKSATGAEQLSSAELIPDSRAIAGQGVKNEGEPSGASSIPSCGTGINRRSIMNMFVSSAAVAAAAPAVALAGEPPVIDDKAALARVEQIVDFLRTRYICEGWKIDERGAELALEYFRRRVRGPAFKDEDEDTDAYYQAIEFFSSHGQSLDWIHDGNPAGLICGLAKHSRRAMETAPNTEHDPIFAAIEAHKAARAEWYKWVCRHGDLESEIPKEKRRSSVTVWDNDIVEADDPRWIEVQREVHRTSDAEIEAACQLVVVVPTTAAGLCALLRHAIDYDTDREGWPQDLETNHGKYGSWKDFLIENLARVVPEMLAA
ncbi:hypothetical protein [Bradyrhizobium elkanii]|uniref:hypothetical protein n=1 Tax=Bradyrhizobium elkanii TaxID=29448 RepID=UPI0004B776CB|nr:hypothetical protein [Bradyrhizobium elkanii]